MTSSSPPFPTLSRAFFTADAASRSAGRGRAGPLAQPAPAGEPAPAPLPTSVLVNTCNHGRFVEECIESLLVQTRLPDEIVVYDDASEDDTVARLRRYGSRLTLLEGRPSDRPPHLRHAHAIQTAFAHSSGRLLFILDGDDRFKRDKIARYLSVFRHNSDAALIQAPLDRIDEHGRIVGHHLEPQKHIVQHLHEIYRQHDVDFFYPSSALAFSRAYLECALPLDFSDGLPLWSDTRLSIVAPYFGRVLTLPERLTDGRDRAAAAAPRPPPWRDTLMRTRVFNAFCRRYGLRTISPWRNRRFYLQLARHTLPQAVYRYFRDDAVPPRRPELPSR